MVKKQGNENDVYATRIENGFASAVVFSHMEELLDLADADWNRIENELGWSNYGTMSCPRAIGIGVDLLEGEYMVLRFLTGAPSRPDAKLLYAVIPEDDQWGDVWLSNDERIVELNENGGIDADVVDGENAWMVCLDGFMGATGVRLQRGEYVIFELLGE